MRAFAYQASGRLALVEKERPALRGGSALLAVRACSICGTDVRTWTHGSDHIVPGTTVGHEVCGVLDFVGPAVSGYVPGDRVTITPAVGCGACPPCRRGATNMCDNLKTVGFDYEGGFAPLMEVPAELFARGHVQKLPSEISDAAACVTERPAAS